MQTVMVVGSNVYVEVNKNPSEQTPVVRRVIEAVFGKQSTADLLNARDTEDYVNKFAWQHGLDIRIKEISDYRTTGFKLYALHVWVNPTTKVHVTKEYQTMAVKQLKIELRNYKNIVVKAGAEIG